MFLTENSDQLFLPGGCNRTFEIWDLKFGPYTTGPLQKLFHYAVFQKFFHICLRYFYGLCFTIHVIKFSFHFVPINHNNV